MKIPDKILTNIEIIILFSVIGILLLFPQDKAIAKTLWQLLSPVI